MVDRSGTRIALISMPWQDPFSPSIQLGTLAAYMGEERPGVRVDTFDLFLELADAVGIYLSKRIAINWLGEALFAYLLFPGQAASIASYLEHSRKDDPAFAAIDYAELIEGLRTTLLARLDAVDWTQYAMVGLSVVFSQTFSSLLAAREIKRRAPGVPIVLGGPGVTGKIGKSLLDAFGFVDYIVNGEGELPLAALVDALEAQPRGTPVDVRGVFHRGSSDVSTAAVHQVADMTVLPVPDYSGYFRTLAATRDPEHVKGRVRIPYETSRGCWWDRSVVDPMQSCAFCNLNLQWGAYREKSVERSVLDLQELVERYDCPDFTVVDNILRYKDVDAFIDRIGELDMGLDLWMEARVSVKPEQMRRLREIGARVIQFGIESLSTSMLKKMVKGTTAIANLQAMKFCEQYGIQNSANLIIEFPGMTEADIAETLDTIASARAYFPLSTTEFSLVYQSPAFKMPQGFGITNVRNYHMYKLLLPPDLYERLFLTEKAFDCEELDRLKPMWRTVKAAVDDWREHYRRMQPSVEGGLLLSLQDAGSYLKIRDFRGRRAEFHWLHGLERDVYLECERTITRTDLYARFPWVEPERIDAWIDRWRAQRILFAEGKKVLALAIPWGPVSAKRTPAPLRVAVPGPVPEPARALEGALR